ncbi:hypothetical protein TanjilG_14390 [Lupinus angustifolius]|uniref:Uncharacterized protein n=1 Tax=Lupinus angustifolius TaxID=3871 RepID=A0A1J7FUS2_LUPAN|nr:PREDICTED: protein POLLENLESS 3-like [Lupinus angustifolius]OIV91811.1 hypothetical protein TanjilG_14390 [Lupinus angustifolius]
MVFQKSSTMSCFNETPKSSWKSRTSRFSPLSERKKSPASLNNKDDLFHIIHKVPAGDSPYVKAKQVQLVDKNPGRAISMFWAAINAGDRVESALKDMALVMKQLNRSDEAVEAIKSFRYLCPPESQDSMDNILVELYKRSGRVDEEIDMLHHKLKQIEDGVTFVGRTTKQARSQGRTIQVTAEQEISRILGNLAWAYLQKGDYKTAEEHYRKALSFEVDRNKQCNLAICLMQMNKITEAKFLLQAVTTATKNRKMDDSFVKSFERASQMLIEMGSSPLGDPVRNMPQCSPQRSVDVEVPHARRRLYESPDPTKTYQKMVPYTAKKCSWGFNNGHQRETWGDVHSDPKPSFRNGLSSPSNGWSRTTSMDGAKEYPTPIGKDQNLDQGPQISSSTSSVHNSPGNEKSSENFISLSGNRKPAEKKSWADLVEDEEEQDLFYGSYANFDSKGNAEMLNDENADSNIVFQQKDRNTVRRSLCFYEDPTPPSKERDSFSSGDIKLARRNRLQVFQDITPETP